MDWSKAIEKLHHQTNAGAIQWEPGDETMIYRHFERDNIEGQAYFTELGDKHIAVYEYKYRTIDDFDQPTWTSAVAVEFVTGDGRIEWRWPVSGPALFSLIEAIRFKTSGAEKFFEGFLKDDEPTK
ncbi:MAG TPA: hypothetical protein VE093_10925 [Polyangiaceae bacterium]|nr:hypothetical protein [Polyangiaceae bacterium]